MYSLYIYIFIVEKKNEKKSSAEYFSPNDTRDKEEKE